MKLKLNKYNISDETELYLNQSHRKVMVLISECDIGLSPITPIEKYKVATPSKVIEYLSCGLPIVCNNEIYDQADIIQASKAGFSVKYEENEFKTSILTILRNKKLYETMSFSGRKWIHDNRTYDNLSISLINKYNQINKSV